MNKALGAHDRASHARSPIQFKPANEERKEAVTKLAEEMEIEYKEAFDNMVDVAAAIPCTVCGKTHD